MSREQYIAKLVSIVHQLNDLGVQRLVEAVDFMPDCSVFVEKSEKTIFLNQWKKEHNGKKKAVNLSDGDW